MLDTLYHKITSHCMTRYTLHLVTSLVAINLPVFFRRLHGFCYVQLSSIMPQLFKQGTEILNFFSKAKKRYFLNNPSMSGCWIKNEYFWFSKERKIYWVTIEWKEKSSIKFFSFFWWTRLQWPSGVFF